MPTSPPDLWTVETLKAYFEAILAEREKSIAARFASMEKETAMSLRSAEQAVLKAEASAERRFESVNEFRNTLSDQQRNLMPRSEVGVVAGALTDKITALEKQFDALQAERTGMKGAWGYFVGAIGLLIGIGGLLMVGLRFLQVQLPTP